MGQFIYPLTYETSNPFIASEFWQLWIKLVYTSVYRRWFGHMFSSFLDKYQGAWDGTILMCKCFFKPVLALYLLMLYPPNKETWLSQTGRGELTGRNGLVLSVGRKAKSFDETDCLLGREDFWSAVQSSPLMHTLWYLIPLPEAPSCWTGAHLTCRGSETNCWIQWI